MNLPVFSQLAGNLPLSFLPVVSTRRNSCSFPGSTIVGYYNGAWTTDRRRALTLRWREAAEAHAARMRDSCPRNAELITVEEIAAAD